ncbi:MAG: hypothetical protein JWM35_1931, partial [Verrucomicrobia bacterium]|nr:hypothetical protein [Verrucomicrobiota bacterium]
MTGRDAMAIQGVERHGFTAVWRLMRAMSCALLFGAGLSVFGQVPPAPGERDIPPDEARKNQRVDKSPPPKSPGQINPDTGAPLPPPKSASPDSPTITTTTRTRDTGAPALAPGEFNPDPGAAQKPKTSDATPFFQSDRAMTPAQPEMAPVDPKLALPRGPLEETNVETRVSPSAAPTGTETVPVPKELELPRAGTRSNQYIFNSWEAPEDYEMSRSGPRQKLPSGTKPVMDRWRDAPFYSWRRYTSGDTNELPYYKTKPDLWHYYRQSILKGDLPIRGQDLFLNLTASADLVYEDRKITLPSNVSSSRAGSFDFFGQSRSQIFVTNFAIQADLFRGETVFKPVEWLIRVKPVFNFNRIDLRETLVSPDPRGSVSSGVGSPPNNGGVVNPGDIDVILNPGLSTTARIDSSATHRNKDYVALQEAFVEVHLKDLSENYDFVAVKIGNQAFNSDFRGFIFNDTNLGVRFFGNAQDNRWQYNFAVFDMREKDTNSELNTFNQRDQRVVIANVYRQDFLVHGYTAQASVHFNFDDGATYYDTNGMIVRPAPIGAVKSHHVNVGYLGWAGDGHVGRWNVSHAAYVALGRDDFNGIAGKPVSIRGEMAAVEVSYDRDWIRYKASLFWASGDGNAKDNKATGFDSIVDNTNFVGGPFSYYVRQGFNLAGTALNMKQRFSLLPNIRTSKTEGQANFVNPGLRMGGLGADLDVTPKVRVFANANYIWFDDVDPIQTVLLTNQVGRAFGADLSLGTQWRPLLKDNVVISTGIGALLPGRGFRDIYRTVQPSVPGFTPSGLSPKVDKWLYSAVLA